MRKKKSRNDRTVSTFFGCLFIAASAMLIVPHIIDLLRTINERSDDDPLNLQLELQHAVAVEDYETAAVIRDRIAKQSATR